MIDTVYNSRSPHCKAPFGAVASGTKVRLTARPESCRFPLRGFVCVEFERDYKTVEIPMENIGSNDGREVFTALVETDGYVGLCFYHFRFENDGGCFRYGARPGHTGGECEFYGALTARPYQLTVYSPEETRPDWFGEGVTYQIFPDRFARTGEPDRELLNARSRLYHENWSDTPMSKPESFEGRYDVTNRDFFGGNLRGIINKLDYLQSLGVSCIYLNPIFEAFSNHRYDTADYHKIDPLLGDENDFRELCDRCAQNGIRVVLDGVFSHTGADSVYFNRRGSYNSRGAYQTKDSPYYSWYKFAVWPHKYAAWWGIDTLPETDELDPSFRRFIADSRDAESVVRKWLRAGAAGWRLDVADELPDEFIADIHNAARAEKPDALVLGEVWEDASNKIAYSKRRAYLLGGMLDGVMGYTFRTALLAFLQGGSSHTFRDEMLEIEENYPPKAFQSSLNILGTHDTPRIITVLGTYAADWLGSKDRRAELTSHEYLHERAVALVKIAALVQYAFPGTPSTYYGDEAGLEGSEDPYCRRGYPWDNQNKELLDWYITLGSARRELKPLRRGAMRYVGSTPDVLAFVRTLDGESVYAIVNRASEPRPFPLDGGIYHDYMSGKTMVVSRETMLEPYSALLLVLVPTEGCNNT